MATDDDDGDDGNVQHHDYAVVCAGAMTRKRRAEIKRTVNCSRAMRVDHGLGVLGSGGACMLPQATVTETHEFKRTGHNGIATCGAGAGRRATVTQGRWADERRRGHRRYPTGRSN